VLVKDKLSPQAFYSRALSRAERLRLAEARELQGLDEEIALLRVKLQRLAEEHPERLDLLFKGVGLLVRAVSTRYKLSPSSQEDLAASIAGVLKGIGGVLGLEEHDGSEGD
jgi:hypothetical protein